MMVDDHANLGRRDRGSEARRHQRCEIGPHGGRTPGSEHGTVVCPLYESRPPLGCVGDGPMSTASILVRM
jgi:hypothetical protein